MEQPDLGRNSEENVTGHPLAPPLGIGFPVLRLLGLTFAGAARGGLSAVRLGQCGLHACEASAGPG